MARPVTRIPRTKTMPERQFVHEDELIVALQEYGGEAEYPLSLDKVRFRVGKGRGVDVEIPNPHVSAQHARIERHGRQLRIIDERSKNGIWVDGRRERELVIDAGGRVDIASTPLVALDGAMRVVRPVLRTLVSAQGTTADDILIAAITETPVLILARPGSEARPVAEAIHRASRRRRAPLSDVTTPSLAEVNAMRDGTVLVAVTEHTIHPASLVTVLSSIANVRPIAIAPDIGAAITSLGAELVARAHVVTVRPVRERADIPALLDHLFAIDGTPLRLRHLTDENRRALCGYPYANIDEIRDAAHRVAGMAAAGSINKAAPLVGVQRSTLHHWAGKQIGLTAPLLASDPPWPPARRQS